MLTIWVSTIGVKKLCEHLQPMHQSYLFERAILGCCPPKTGPWCLTYTSVMLLSSLPDAFGCLRMSLICFTCGPNNMQLYVLMHVVAGFFFWLDLSVKWQVAAYSWSPLNYADNSWEKCFTCLETSVIYNFESRPALLACDTLYHTVSTVIDLCIYILKYTYIYICVYKCMYMTLYMSIRA